MNELIHLHLLRYSRAQLPQTLPSPVELAENTPEPRGRDRTHEGSVQPTATSQDTHTCESQC